MTAKKSLGSAPWSFWAGGNAGSPDRPKCLACGESLAVGGECTACAREARWAAASSQVAAAIAAWWPQSVALERHGRIRRSYCELPGKPADLGLATQKLAVGFGVSVEELNTGKPSAT